MLLCFILLYFYFVIFHTPNFTVNTNNNIHIFSFYQYRSSGPYAWDYPRSGTGTTGNINGTIGGGTDRGKYFRIEFSQVQSRHNVDKKKSKNEKKKPINK